MKENGATLNTRAVLDRWSAKEETSLTDLTLSRLKMSKKRGVLEGRQEIQPSKSLSIFSMIAKTILRTHFEHRDVRGQSRPRSKDTERSKMGAPKLIFSEFPEHGRRLSPI